MNEITVKDIVRETGGTLLCGLSDTPITDLTYDSRTAKKGSLYVPLPGERVDGHQFIQAAFENGASAAFTSRPLVNTFQSPCILVENTKDAMQITASYMRSFLSLPIIGITGSVGKTTTRSMVAEALSAGKTVYQTKGNLNSQIGVPVMIAGIGQEEVAVLEMGMSEFGEMDRLSYMVRPDIAVITCIGVAHINQLKTQENICKEKLAIAHGMKEEGIVLLNGDDPILRAHQGELIQKTFLYGTTKDCDYYARDIHIVDGRARFTAVFSKEHKTQDVSLSMPGEHNVLNALAALAICDRMRVSLSDAAKKLQEFEGIKMRQQIYPLEKFTIIDDSYNANPDSMKAGLRVLAEYPANGRRIAVLGDMLELGEQQIQYHEEIGAFAAQNGVDLLLSIGELSSYMEKAAKQKNPLIKTQHFKEKEDLVLYVKEILQTGDIIFLKASRGMALNTIVEELKKEDHS